MWCGGEVTPFRCASCILSFYCSKDCQKKDWKKGHPTFDKAVRLLFRNEPGPSQQELDGVLVDMPTGKAAQALTDMAAIKQSVDEFRSFT
jgi:hypothetical protein